MNGLWDWKPNSHVKLSSSTSCFLRVNESPDRFFWLCPMQAQLLVGPIPTALDGSCSIPSLGFNSPSLSCLRRRNRCSSGRNWGTAASASWAAEQDHYAVLGVTQNASATDIKRAYRLLARKYHPDVNKNSQDGELFKSIRRAYEILSDEVTRSQYDKVVRFREDNGSSYNRQQHYRPEFQEDLRFYKWAEVRRRMQHKEFWNRYNPNDSFSDSDTETPEDEANLNQERGPFSQVLAFAFISLFLLQTFGSQVALAFSSVVALFDWKLDTGYKAGYVIAWILGGRAGILLTLCLRFASWACGKTSSSIVALIVVAMWVGSNLARHAPLPPGALLTLLYMSIRLQADLNGYS